MSLVKRGNSTYRYEKGKYMGKVSGLSRSKSGLGGTSGVEQHLSTESG